VDGNCLYTTKTVRISLGRAVRIVNGTLRNSGRSIGIAGAIQQALGQNDDSHGGHGAEDSMQRGAVAGYLDYPLQIEQGTVVRPMIN
jgi:hypothetical protein